jgi:hypothetical protein
VLSRDERKERRRIGRRSGGRWWEARYLYLGRTRRRWNGPVSYRASLSLFAMQRAPRSMRASVDRRSDGDIGIVDRVVIDLLLSTYASGFHIFFVLLFIDVIDHMDSFPYIWT